jgi:hypothetical protein
MKGTDFLVIGGLGIGAYLLLSQKSTETATTPGASGSAGGGFSLGGISLPGISIGGLGGGVSSGFMSAIMTMFDKTISAVAGGGGGGGGGSLLDVVTKGGDINKTIDDIIHKLTGETGLEGLLQEYQNAKDAYGDAKTAMDVIKSLFGLSGEIPKKGSEAWNKLIESLNPGESPTPKGQAGPNSEFDIYSWFSQHINPYADTKNVEAPKTAEPVKASYEWGWSWLPDILNQWLGSKAWENRAVNAEGFVQQNVPFSPYIDMLIKDPSNVNRGNLPGLTRAEAENYAVSIVGPRPGTPELGGEWNLGLFSGGGYNYYIPGF